MNRPFPSGDTQRQGEVIKSETGSRDRTVQRRSLTGRRRETFALRAVESVYAIKLELPFYRMANLRRKRVTNYEDTSLQSALRDPSAHNLAVL